jgi:hypothetical protein
VEKILSRSWRAFGHLHLRVDDPPRWHHDYLVDVDLSAGASSSAFALDHRKLPHGADIKLLWELSRWSQLTRLAMAAYVLDDGNAAVKCVEWLDDWVEKNPPYYGWNWTSALEVGIRLIQFAWIDALLSNAAIGAGLASVVARLASLRGAILRPHASFAWRYHSFGSSANNHLLGELAGLIVATARWPALERVGAPLRIVQQRWEHEVLAQFSLDGANREQALNYHLFSFELCWHAIAALRAAGCSVSPRVCDRLSRAAGFYVSVQVDSDRWDYGDSDDAVVAPLATSDATAAEEWRQWLISPRASPSIDYWLGNTGDVLGEIARDRSESQSPPSHLASHQHQESQPRSDGGPSWVVHSEGGLAICRSGPWTLRADLSALGYLKTAAHGHLDALHLSLWFHGVAIVIDPGTGAYYADPTLRAWLASRAAHNAPCPAPSQFPTRLGPFLWANHHQLPTWSSERGQLRSGLKIPGGQLYRTVEWHAEQQGWDVTDVFESHSASSHGFDVRWQFAPGARIQHLGDRRFLVERAGHTLHVEINGLWTSISLVQRASERGNDIEFAGTVSPHFRQICFGPYLLLRASGPIASGAHRTSFLSAGYP